MLLINNRAINKNNKIKNSILKSLINYMKYHRATNENYVIKLKCLLKIMIFKDDISIISAFLNFCYNEYIY